MTTPQGEKANRFPPLLVIAIVREIKGDKVVAEHHFDFNDKEKRTWFNEKCIIWAVHNGHSVELLRASDDE